MICRVLMVLVLLCLTSAHISAGQAHQSLLNPEKAAEAKKYPRIVLFSVSWCPHCREAKEYLTRNSIPFINRDVEMDEKAMEELTEKYKSTGVPVIVIGVGNQEQVIKGFSPELFHESLKKAQTNK